MASLSHNAPSFISDDPSRLNKSSKLYASPSPLSQALYPYLASLGPHCSESSLHYDQGGNRHLKPNTCTSSKDARSVPTLLDTRQWSPSPNFAAAYAPSGSHLPWMDVKSHVSLPLSVGGPNGNTGPSVPYHTLVPGTAANSVAIPQTQQYLTPGFLSSMGYHFSHVGTGPSHSGIVATSSSPGWSKDLGIVQGDESQFPVVIYRPTEKKGSARPCFQRACAINTEGLWIDKEDLSTGAKQIVVHECQWAWSSNPCGMWIIGSRSSVGAHIRKWHTQRRSNRTECLWDGCTKTMHKGSINRHVVTIHLGEGFFCQGCDGTFSRKDVYDDHIKKGEVCKDASAVMVYGTERRGIDINRALQPGNAVRYAD